MPELVSLQDIAARLGVRYRTVVQWRHRGLLPEPETVAGRSAVWEWPVIEQWARSTGRLPAD